MSPVARAQVPYVRQRIADYMTNLVSFGFSGLRIDAAKHIQPGMRTFFNFFFESSRGCGDFLL